jgi:hypothetical protein
MDAPDSKNVEITAIYNAVTAELTKHDKIVATPLFFNQQRGKSTVSYFALIGDKLNLTIVRNHFYQQYIATATDVKEKKQSLVRNQSAEQIKIIITDFIRYHL